MNSKNFSILFAILTIILQIIGIYLMFMIYNSMGIKGLLLGISLYFFICILFFYMLTKIKITDNNKPVHIWDVFGDIIALTVSLVISTIAVMIVSMVILHSRNHDSKIWAGIPISVIAIIYGGLGMMAEIKKN